MRVQLLRLTYWRARVVVTFVSGKYAAVDYFYSTYNAVRSIAAFFDQELQLKIFDRNKISSDSIR